MSQKVFIIKSVQEHFWQSCRIIEHHTLAAIRESDLRYEIFETDGELSTEQLAVFSNSSAPIHLYFLSDVLKYQTICAQLTELKNIRYYFPIYGNMTMEVYRWLELGEMLKGRPVFFICASPRSCEQIRLFTDTSAIHNIPYPFATSFHTKKRSSSTIDLVYAGRITAQKNVVALLSAFNQALEHRPELRLHLAGSYHERGYHLHGYDVEPTRFKAQVEELIKNSGGKVIYQGELSQDQLFKLYAASDYFISMSTYHDEDFGMSAAQAYSLGLGMILSNWGGHGAYEGLAKLVDVFIDQNNLPQIRKTALIKLLVVLTKNTPSSNLDLDFSYPTFINRLKTVLLEPNVPYKGQSPLYLEYAERALKMFPFFNDEKGRSLYSRIYQSYMKQLDSSK